MNEICMTVLLRQFVSLVIGLGTVAFLLMVLFGDARISSTTMSSDRAYGDSSTAQPGLPLANTAPEVSPSSFPTRVSVGDATVFIEIEGNVNRLVLERGGQRYVLGSGDIDFSPSESLRNVGRLSTFRNVRLNADGRYAMVTTIGWEWAADAVYDLATREKILELGSYVSAFTPDGLFAFSCEANDFGGEYSGKVMELRSRAVVYDMPIPSNFGAGRGTIDCALETDHVIVFTIRTFADAEKREQETTYRFDLTKFNEDK